MACRVLLAAGLAGCASPMITVSVPYLERIDVRPAQGDQRLIDRRLQARAEAYASRFEHASAWHGEGVSMQPLIEPDSWVVVRAVPFAELQPGNVVLYTNDDGLLVVHALIRLMDGGWVVAGVNNGQADRTLVTSGNCAGVVIAAFTPVNGPVR